jgi:dihydrofolate synthase / folylpolyglutamate synthase
MSDFSLADYLQSFLDVEQSLDKAHFFDLQLERMHKLLEAFGHPEDHLRFVHVAGSKGKGSTCAYLAEILRASGYRVGLYTSPHLYSPFERIRVLEAGSRGQGAGKTLLCSMLHAPCFEGMITEEEATDRLSYYAPVVDELRKTEEITFYELWTALALSFFDHKKVNVVVLETGLGGRLDATNAVDTMVCGITPIGLEHTAILGDTLAEIAAEKAAIIKLPTQKVVLAPQEKEAREVLQKRCEAFGIRPNIVGETIGIQVQRQSAEGVEFDVVGRRPYKGLRTRLAGAHQAWNAALAIGMAEDLEVFGFMITEESVRQGVLDTRWPVRFEIVPNAPTLVLDAAHTVESAKAVAETFRSVYPGKKAFLVIGMSQDKRYGAFCNEFKEIAGSVIFTRSKHPRSREFHSVDVARLLPSADKVVTKCVPRALEEAFQRAGSDGIVLVTGSIFVCAEARETLGA